MGAKHLAWPLPHQCWGPAHSAAPAGRPSGLRCTRWEGKGGEAASPESQQEVVPGTLRAGDGSRRRQCGREADVSALTGPRPAVPGGLGPKAEGKRVLRVCGGPAPGTAAS